MQVHLAVDEEQPLLGRKAEGRTFTTGRVAGTIAAVCGVVGLAALKRTSAGAPLLGAAKSADPFNDVLQRQSSQFEELAASRQEGIKMMAELQVYAFVHPEGMSNLGASEYQTCVAPNSAPKNGYKKTDVGTIREDLVFATDLFTTERNNAQPVTEFANSAAAVTSISCKAPPAIKFSDTKVCEEDRGFCDNNCYMPVPENCAEGKKNFGSCSPTVGSVCASITDVSDGCNTISEEINAERAKYTAMDPGASPCADTPGTPYKIASEKQGEYQTALNMWAGAVNDATEVCTVGHGLLVHNEGMYDRHYEVMKEITADLKELCDQSDGANKFDFGAAVADAQKNSIPTVRRRKLVWWQQLCEPTLTSLEQIMDSLEIASPQLQCFAEKCTEKKATEANAFKALKAAHNGYVSALNTYKTKADAFNGYVDTKEEQKAGVIAKLESFHAGKQANSKIYARDKASFDRFDSGADAGHCGLTSCQVKTVCHAHIKDYFASFINPDTCQAVPMTVDQVCKGTTRVEDADAAKAAAEKAAAEKAAAEKAAAEKAAAEKAAAEKKAADEKAAAEKAAAAAAANMSPLEQCQAKCAAENQCCNNDITQGSNQNLSCLQACMVVKSGVSKDTCLGYCGTRTCSYNIGGKSYSACSVCDDVPAHQGYFGGSRGPKKPANYQCSATYGTDTDSCKVGCNAGAEGSAATPSAVPKRAFNNKGEITRAVNDCAGNNWAGDECVMNNWDVSKVTDMGHMLRCSGVVPRNFNQDISAWDVSNVVDMNNMLGGCQEFNQDLSRWDVSKVKMANGLFSGCSKFNADISRWNPASAVNWEFLFNYASSFNQDISGWRFPSGYSKWDNFFRRASSMSARNAPAQCPSWALP